MKPVYVRKTNPRERKTWIDRFVASDPKGGFRWVIEHARKRSV